MKRFSLLLLGFIISVFLGCAEADVDGAVSLDGPILESVSHDGNLQFNGSVVNNGDTPVTSVFVVITLVDEEGNIVGANSVQVGEDGDESQDDLLFPGERNFFTVMMNTIPNEAVSKNVEIFFETPEDFQP